ncbi:unnamed protein product [Prorocentrum cordatum]|uniref:Phospholipid/glycerol acyltransferase domain-containing protein n=1 Tax=Prorocentrum cordatum TaxID=2364126 RepID=A0ABN9VPB8_9DINO|nr:unnamed protein product [Polarella glacialis]
MALLAKRWGAARFLFVSTAFVHAVPAATVALQETSWWSSVTSTRWSSTGTPCRTAGGPRRRCASWASRTHSKKAVAEHLILQACNTEGVQAQIVRPSIVTPAWAAPYAGWSGDKPSTIVAAQLLLLKRGLRIFRCSAHPCPLVPVDVVACAAIQALVTSAPTAGSAASIVNATVDISEADRVPSFQLLVNRFYQLLALRGDVSLPEAGLIFRLNRLAENATAFWLLDRLMNVLPNAAMALGAKATLFAAQTVGLDSTALQKQCKTMQLIGRYSTLPAQYEPFSSPSSGWLFRSKVRLPDDWDPVEYNVLIQRAAILFAESSGKSTPPPRFPADTFHDICIVSSRPWWSDALAALSMPGSPLLLSCADFLIRQVLKWMDLTVKVDAASLVSATQLSQPLVLCPTHRSVLDFVIIGVTCFRLRLLLPRLQVPHVAADAEFAGLPVLGGMLGSLGAFYVRRGGGSVQPDPALRAEVSRVFQKGRPLEVFLEGRRSRGRRQLRLRSGLLRALRDVSQRTVALVPIALSYELLPEDNSFFDELKGCPRPPLTTSALVDWVLRGMCGELPSFGEAYVRLGAAHVLDASAELPVLLSEVQEQLVTLTSITALHARALAELLELPPAAVSSALRGGGMQVRESCLPPCTPLTDSERWSLALQTATLLRARLPHQWARWLVEPVLERGNPDCSEPPPSAPPCSAAAPVACCAQPAVASEAAAERNAPAAPAASEARAVLAAAGGPPQLDADAVAASLALRLEAAEDAAHDVARALRDGGVARVTEEHLLQQLLQPHADRRALPPPLARGAACIVAGRLGPGMVSGYGVSREKPSVLKPIAPLWPTAPLHTEQRCDEESLDRWGFKDTRFAAQWVDGRPAIQVTSTRYGSLGRQPLYQLWDLFQKELRVSMSVRDTLQEEAPAALPPPAAGLVRQLAAVVAEGRICTDPEARLRACTGHGLADIWRLRARALPRAPDAVVRPAAAEERSRPCWRPPRATRASPSSPWADQRDVGAGAPDAGGGPEATGCPGHARAQPRALGQRRGRGRARGGRHHGERSEGGTPRARREHGNGARLDGVLHPRRLDRDPCERHEARPLREHRGHDPRGQRGDPQRRALAAPGHCWWCDVALGLRPRLDERRAAQRGTGQRGVLGRRDLGGRESEAPAGDCRVPERCLLRLGGGRPVDEGGRAPAGRAAACLVPAHGQQAAPAGAGHPRRRVEEQAGIGREGRRSQAEGRAPRGGGCRHPGLRGQPAGGGCPEGCPVAPGTARRRHVGWLQLWRGGVRADLCDRLPEGLRAGPPDTLRIAGDDGPVVGGEERVARRRRGGQGGARSNAPARAAVPDVPHDPAVRRGRRAVHVPGRQHRRPRAGEGAGGFRAPGARGAPCRAGRGRLPEPPPRRGQAPRGAPAADAGPGVVGRAPRAQGHRGPCQRAWSPKRRLVGCCTCRAR